ncbi:MAG: hypothetical protein ACRD0G_10855 [Acidimicrobiales bacterium]
MPDTTAPAQLRPRFRWGDVLERGVPCDTRRSGDVRQRFRWEDVPDRVDWDGRRRPIAQEAGP